MEIKLNFDKDKTSTSSAQARQPNQARSIRIDGAAAGAVKTEKNTKQLKKIVVLRCGTVMLKNFTEDLAEPGRQLKLVREPENKCDRWATKVVTFSGTELGYLPSWKNQSVARLIDAGKNITVFVDEELNIPEPNPRHFSRESAELPLILYMDIEMNEEDI